MERLTQQTLNQLLQTTDQPCITIYLPTHRKSPQSHQNPIRFSNLVKKAKTLLQKSPLTTHAIKTALQDLSHKEKDENYWQHQSLGLAIFITQTNTTLLRLPLRFKEQVYFLNRFYLKPLMPLLATNGQYYILTLSQNKIKLYQATRNEIDKLTLPSSIPTSLEEIIDPNDLDQHIQFHTRTSGKTGHRSAIYHGQAGASEENLKKQIDQFLSKVEKGISRLLNQETSPLVIIGVDYLTSSYSKKNTYKHLLDQTITGNFDHLTKDKIHKLAWKAIRPHFKNQEKQALEKYHQQTSAHKTTTILGDILQSAYSGRIDTLFITRDTNVWGDYNLKTGQLTMHSQQQPDSVELYDRAAIHTLINGGTVYGLKPKEMIKDSPIAAILRY